MRALQFLSELSNELLGRYKKAAAADAKKADSEGDYERGNKRFKGINRATMKQFDNDAKEHKLDEKSTTEKQARFMAAAAHDPQFAARAGIKQSVAKEFNKADTGTKQLSNAMKNKPKKKKKGFSESLAEQSMQEWLAEMDSQGYTGSRDHKSMSTYGSRDKDGDSDAGKKEYYGKAMTSKQAQDHALDKLKKIMSEPQNMAVLKRLKTKEGVSEGVAETMPMRDAAKVLKHYGAEHFKTTSNELHFYKDGKAFSVDLIWNDDATRSVSLSSLNSATRGLKGQGVAEGLADTQQKIQDTINKLEDRLKHAKSDEQWDRIKDRIERLQAGLKRSKQGVNEFALDGFNSGDDGEEFNPRLAKMAYDEGVVKGVSLADGATLKIAMAINDWDKHDGGIYSQHFAKGFKVGRMNKIRHDNKRHNLNLKLMKDGSIRHGEINEYGDTAKGQKMLTRVQKRAVDRVVSKKADTDPKYAKKNADTADRAWERMSDKDLDEGEVIKFPKKHKSDLDSFDDCPKCGRELMGGKYMGHRVKVCNPCKQVYLPPNSGIDKHGNKVDEIAGAFPSPSTREKWAKDAAISNAAEAKRQADIKAKADAERLRVNNAIVDKEQRINYHPMPDNEVPAKEGLDQVAKDLLNPSGREAQKYANFDTARQKRRDRQERDAHAARANRKYSSSRDEANRVKDGVTVKETMDDIGNWLEEHGKASRSLCTSSKPDDELGASNLASCKSQGLRARDGEKSHLIGHRGSKVRVTVGGKKIKGKKYGGPLPDYGTRKDQL